MVETHSVSLTWWWWAALVASLVSVVAAATAVVLIPAWPEMGARYDSPAEGARASTGPPETNLDIWKALDEGRDPTA